MYKAAGRPDSLSSSDPAHPSSNNTSRTLFGLLPTWLPHPSVAHSPTKSDTSPLPTPNPSQVAFHESIPLANLNTGLAHNPRGATPAMESSDAPLLSGHRRRRSASLIQGVAANNGRAHSLPPRSRRSPIEQLPDLDEGKSRDSDDEGASASSGTSDADRDMNDIGSDEGLDDDEETGLTQTDRRRRRRRKRRNTMLDERVTGGYNLTDEEEELATQSIVKATIMNVILIALWYLLSISISVVSILVVHMAKLFTNGHSTINGCSHPTISTSITLYSPPAFTCSFNLYLHQLFCSLFHLFGLRIASRRATRLPSHIIGPTPSLMMLRNLL